MLTNILLPILITIGCSAVFFLVFGLFIAIFEALPTTGQGIMILVIGTLLIGGILDGLFFAERVPDPYLPETHIDGQFGRYD